MENKIELENNASNQNIITDEATQKNNVQQTKNVEQKSENLNETEQKPKLTKKQEFINLLKFIGFSISAGVIQIVSFTILNAFVLTFEKGVEYGWSYFISLALSVIWNFTFNRKFTFKSAKNVPIAMLLVLAFYCIFTPLSIWWGIALANVGWNEYLILALTMVINFATEFLWTRYVVYRNDINTAPKKEKK